METTSKQTTVRSGLFVDPTSAEAAYQDALKRGYKKDQINVLMSDTTRNKFATSTTGTTTITEVGDKSMQGLALGGALGGTAVGVIAAIVALSTTIVIPGLGLVVAGPLAAGLVGAGAGSIAGGFIGTLIGAGIPEEHAKVYENGIKQGGTVLIVKSNGKDNDDVLLDDWRKNNAKDIF